MAGRMWCGVGGTEARSTRIRPDRAGDRSSRAGILRRRHAQAPFDYEEEFVEIFMYMPDVLPVRVGATQITLVYPNAVGAEQGHEVNPRHVFYRTGQAAEVVSRQDRSTMKFTSTWGQENLP